jgi:DNA-binding MarR family transcriptional regulator
MKKAARANQLKLSENEIGFVAEGLSLTSRQLKTATRSITEEYSLGPRGPWILTLITAGMVFPLDLTNVFRIGRSLITAELIRLNEARLITYRKSTRDRRRVELALTALGEKAVLRVREELAKLVIERFSGYTREEVLLCARMLHDFNTPQRVNVTSPAGPRRPAGERAGSPAPARRRPSRA